MFTYINSKFIKTSVSKKTLTDNSEVTVIDLQSSFSEVTKPICRIYSHDIDCSAAFLDSMPIKDVPVVCSNAMNDTYNNVNTSFDYDVASQDHFYIVAIPFNGMINDIKFSDGIKVLNGFFVKHLLDISDGVTNIENWDKANLKNIKFSKIAYFIFRKVDVEYSGDHHIIMTTSSVSADKKSSNPNAKIKSIYTNDFAFSDSVSTDVTLISTSKRESSETFIDDETHTVAPFISLFMDQIQIDKHFTAKPRNKGRNNNNGRRGSYNEKRIPRNDRIPENFFNDPNIRDNESRSKKKAINKLNENKKKYFED